MAIKINNTTVIDDTRNLVNLGSAITVAQGGTGTTALAANSVILGNGTSAVQTVAPGTSGNILTSNGTTWVSSAPASGGITFSKKTANYTAIDKDGIIADTSSGSFTITLPATPAVGAQVVIVSNSNWATNPVTIARNGSTIEGLAEDMSLNISGVSTHFIYSGTTWEVYAQAGIYGTDTSTYVTLTDAQTLTNKTLTSPTINGGSLNNASTVSLDTNAYFTLSGGSPILAFDTNDYLSYDRTNNIAALYVGGSPKLSISASSVTASQLSISGGYTETVFAVSGTTPALSPTNGTIQTWTLSGNSTPTAGTWAEGQSITLMVADGTAYTITWTSIGVIWAGGSAPTLPTSGYAVIELWKVGTTIYGASVGDVA